MSSISHIFNSISTGTAGNNDSDNSIKLPYRSNVDEYSHSTEKSRSGSPLQMIDQYCHNKAGNYESSSKSLSNHKNLSSSSYDAEYDDESYSQKFFGESSSVENFTKVPDILFDRDFDEDDEESHTHFLGTPRTIKRQHFSFDDLPRLQDINDNFLVETINDKKHICDGSHSNIYKGNFQDRAVILKVLLDKDVQNITANKEFENEIMVLSKLSHPHILRPIGVGKMDSELTQTLTRLVIVLEALEGNTLAHHLSLRRSFSTKPFSQIRYLRIAKEFASALFYIHDQIDPNCKLIHRDLKPDNIGFMKDGTLKLMDFGLSVSLKKGENIDGSYKLTGCTGSLRYMAPEVALSKPYNEKVDIYGFGMILYQIITGVMPFQGYNKDKFYLSVVNGKYRPPIDYDDYGRDIKISDTLRNLIISCWDNDHINRPSAAAAYEILELLECNKSSKNAKRSVLRRSIQKVASILSKQDTI